MVARNRTMPQPLEVILPEQKPALEWILGRAVPKMSPRTRHALLQPAFAAALHAWSAGRYIVGTEWRFRLAPSGEIRRPLVADIAVIPRDGLRGLEDRDFDSPPYGPTIVVEILSPGEKPAHLEHKRSVYFACGTLLMLVVDPIARTVEAFGHDGTVRRFDHDDTLTAGDFPDLQISLRRVFAAIDFD
jgi:Uma2 family endonuclease